MRSIPHPDSQGCLRPTSKARVLLSLALLLAAGSSRGASTEPSSLDGTLRVNLAASRRVTPIIYGFHYEEIGMIGEGGLHAELVRNRGLEEANPAPGLEVRDGLYVGVPDPRAPAKRVPHTDPLIGWRVVSGSESALTLSRVDTHPLNPRNPHSLQVEVHQAPDRDSGAPGFENTGFFGMHFRKGIDYRLSLYCRAEDPIGPLEVQLSDGEGGGVSQVAAIDHVGPDWTRHTATLTATGTVTRGTLRFRSGSRGVFQLDVVSLFPGDTWDEGRSIFRRDIMQNLADYRPQFIRFPGGCIVHGVNPETMYHWKDTIGKIEQRPGAWSKWEPHYRSDGLGYHEFYELCESLGADAMYVTPSGLVCTGWVFREGEDHRHPPVDVAHYTQEALDAIEYALGPIDSRWGAERARNGHPAPFPLKYVEIGNEDFGPRYYAHYDAIYRAIKTKYPDLQLIANSIIGRQNDDKRAYLPQFKDPATLEIFDEHYYQDLRWVITNHFKFDRYARPGPDLFIGELGISERYPLGILGEGVFLMSLERNADLNPLVADRPLMRHWDFVRGGTSSSLLFHTCSNSVKTFNFHLSKLFRDHPINRFHESVWQPATGEAAPDQRRLFSSAGRDPQTGDLILKVINLLDEPRQIRLEAGSRPWHGRARITTLAAREDQMNTPSNPDAVAPVSREQPLALPSVLVFEPRSLTVIQLPL